MKTKLFTTSFIAILLIFSFYGNNMFAQTTNIPINIQNLFNCSDCSNDNQTQEFTGGSNNTSLYNSNDFFMINPLSTVKIVRLNLIFLQKETGNAGNFEENNSEHEMVINDLISMSNSKMANLTNNICGGNNTHSKIQFEFNSIFIKDDYLWNNDNDFESYKCPDRDDWYLRQKALEIDNNPNIPKGIDIFFTNGLNAYNNNVINNDSIYSGVNVYCSLFPDSNLNEGSYVHMPDVFIKYHWMKEWATQQYNQPWDPVVYNWFVSSFAETLIHELGHSYGLSHEYFCPNHNIMNGASANCSHDYLRDPQLIISHRKFSLTNIRNFVKENDSLTDPYIVLSNQLIDFDTRLYRNIIIESGAILTIKNNVYMPKSSKIIVKPGGKLIVDGGKISSFYNNLWQGIQVWGNKNEHQFDIGGVCHQGKVELKNGAIIENARIGVDLWKPNDWNSTGGILVAEDAVFRNNVKSVHALYYKNFNPANSSVEMNNLTRMKNCTFEITEDYLGVESFFKHVDLAHVKGVKFEGCDFSLAENAPNVSEWNQAIAAYGASFSVQAFCTSGTTPCPEEALNKCTFTGFYHAVNALGDMKKKSSFDIRNSIFNNNAYGVRMSKTHQTVNLFNQYKIGTKWDCGAGIHNHLSTGFVIEENDFRQFDENVPGKYFGIITLKSQSINDIYKNNFFKMSYGNYADGKNYIGNNMYKGLTYTCNTNAENYADFYVGGLLYPSIIQIQQGNINYAAGNTFSANGRWHFYNGGVGIINYYYDENTPEQIPDDNKIYNVASIGINVSNNCPSHYGGNSNVRFVLTPEELQQAENDFNNHYSDYLNVKTLYNSYMDGGNTEGEIMDIETAQPSDAWVLRDKLLGHSPHLSMEVLKKAADRTEVLNETALFDILAANPDELKKDTLISYLRNKEQPLPEYMIAILRQIAEGTTYKTVLQQQMAKHVHNYTESAYAIIRSHIHSESGDPAQVRYWLGKLKGIAYDREIITSYISEGNFTDAITLANMLPELYQMDDKQLKSHGRYMELLTLYQTLHQENRNVFQLNDNELALVDDLATYEDAAGTLAKNIKEGAYGSKIFLACPETPEGDADIKSYSNVNMQQFNVAKGLSIDVRPNPAKNWAIFYYTLPEYENDGTLTIQDINGNTVKVFHLNNKIGQALLHTEEMQNGTYLYTITVGGMTQSGKFVVRK